LEIIVLDFLKFFFKFLEFLKKGIKKETEDFKFRIERIPFEIIPAISNSILIFIILSLNSSTFPCIMLFAIPFYLDDWIVERWKLSHIYKTKNSGNRLFESLPYIFLSSGILVSLGIFVFWCVSIQSQVLKNFNIVLVSIFALVFFFSSLLFANALVVVAVIQFFDLKIFRFLGIFLENFFFKNSYIYQDFNHPLTEKYLEFKNKVKNESTLTNEIQVEMNEI
jgi:hypothetical protein